MGSRILDKPREKTTSKFKEPPEYFVILLNDDYTTMDFVVEILMAVFNKNLTDANNIMLEIHEKGKGVVGRYPWDIAVTMVEQVHTAARENEFPLRCVVESA